MSVLNFIQRPFVFLSITFQEFLHWYFIQMPGRIMRRYWEYFQAFCEIFSFWFLIKTLLAPWKQIVDRSEKRGFDPGAWAQRFTLNVTTRVIGFLFRITALIFGMICQSVVFAGFFTYFVLWLTFPILFLFGLSYLVASLSQ